MKTFLNIIWIVFGGLFTALGWWFIGAICYITILGIPLGRQAFKMARLTLAPFGKTIVYGGGAPSIIANIFWVLIAGIPMAVAYIVIGAGYCMHHHHRHSLGTAVLQDGGALVPPVREPSPGKRLNHRITRRKDFRDASLLPGKAIRGRTTGI